MRTTTLAIALIACGLLACGGRQHVHPDCLDDYDACINICAPQCEQSQMGIGVPDDDRPVNTWTAECERCTDRCDDIARSCSERAERRLPDD